MKDAQEETRKELEDALLEVIAAAGDRELRLILLFAEELTREL